MFVCAFNKMFSVIFLLFTIVAFVHGDCGIVSKHDWEGLSPTKVQYLPRPVKLVIVQHTATATCATEAGCVDIVRSIQNVHMETNGWWDIGQSFLIGGQGKVYEGAGWLHVGAHTYGYNSRSIGVSLIGNFNEDQPTVEALDALASLLDCGVKNGHITSDYQLVAHRQLIATESPGRKVYNELRKWPHFVKEKSEIKKN